MSSIDHTAGSPARKRGMVRVVCPDCGQSRIVRRDTVSGLFKACRVCSATKASNRPKPSMKLGEMVPCEACGKTYYRRPSESNKRACSKSCGYSLRRAYPIEQRTCLHCGRHFAFSIKPHSNSSGTYCSFECRNLGYKGYHHGRPSYGWRWHRSGWRVTRRQFKANGNDACKSCGQADGKLSVHHIEPYRVSRNDDFSNLVTLCTKCHGAAESLSDWIEGLTACRRPGAIRVCQEIIAEGIRGRRDLWRSAESRLNNSTMTQVTPGDIPKGISRG